MSVLAAGEVSPVVLEVERVVLEWVTGVRAMPGPGRTVVTETDEWLPELRRTGVIDAAARVLARQPGGPDVWRTYQGTFGDPTGDLVFPDGYRLRQVAYSAAEFSCLDVPTALLVTDDADFSAFLRDADIAWRTGHFAQTVSHPLATVANVAALGAGGATAGPDDRLYVFADGTISTAPTGRRLGSAQDGPQSLSREWQSALQLDDSQCTVSLATAVADADRVEALNERHWLSRYLVVLGVLRDIRSRHLTPTRVSGFGSRLSASTMPMPDAPSAPVVVEVGHTVWAVHPQSLTWLELSPDDVPPMEGLAPMPSALRNALTAAGFPDGAA